MRSIIKKFKTNSRDFWKKENLPRLYESLAFVLFAFIVQKISEIYLSKIIGVPVRDMLLDRLPNIDIEFFLVEGSLIATFLGIFLFFYKPKYIFFGLKAFSMFIIVRAIFVSLTHLGYSPNTLQLDTNSLGFSLYDKLYNTKNDFFFSGHTGMPFLIGLVFFPEKKWRYIFFSMSIILGLSVLIARIHYSIDVLAAPFITYSIYSLAQYLFKRDFEYSRKAINNV